LPTPGARTPAAAADGKDPAMTPPRHHDAVVDAQFGAQATAYLTSAVHAAGADLTDLVAMLGDQPKARVLDLGCGGGHVTYTVAPHVREVVACDLSADMLATVAAEAERRGLTTVSTRQAQAAALPFDDASFDGVLSRYSAHHWPDLGAGLREIARVLRPGGRAGIVDVVSPGVPLLDTALQTMELLRDCSHVRDWARAEWEAALAQAGLSVTASRSYRVPLDFTDWITRMRTPPVQAEAIRAVQTAMAEDVRRHFAIGPDGGFTLDVALFEATAPA